MFNPHRIVIRALCGALRSVCSPNPNCRPPAAGPPPPPPPQAEVWSEARYSDYVNTTLCDTGPAATTTISARASASRLFVRCGRSARSRRPAAAAAALPGSVASSRATHTAQASYRRCCASTPTANSTWTSAPRPAAPPPLLRAGSSRLPKYRALNNSSTGSLGETSVFRVVQSAVPYFHPGSCMVSFQDPGEYVCNTARYFQNRTSGAECMRRVRFKHRAPSCFIFHKPRF